MKTTINAKNKISDKSQYLNSEIIGFTFESDEACPLCKRFAEGDHLHAVVYKLNYETLCVIFNRCRVCNKMYINTYKTTLTGANELKSEGLISSEPKHFEKQSFDEKINTISPAFVEIFNQSYQAEVMDLNHIAGMGYRKAVEFLVKDFAISEKPEDADKIKVMHLSNCISNYVDDTRIKNLALKSAWIGNDESHYLKKHTDRDITDLKNFIKAMVYFIGMYFIEKDAETISHA